MNNRYTATEVTSKEIVDRIQQSIKHLTTNQLERLEQTIHVELLERDDSYVGSMDDNLEEGGKL